MDKRSILVVCDLETDSLDPLDNDSNLVEVALILVDEVSLERIDSYEAYVQLSDETRTRGQLEWERNHATALTINGVTWEMLEAKGKPRSIVAAEILRFFQRHCVKSRPHSAKFLSHNIVFDRAFFHYKLMETKEQRDSLPYMWIDTQSIRHAVIALEREQYARRSWLGRMFFAKPPDLVPGYGLASLAKTYNIEKEPAHHKAINGAELLLKVYEAMIKN